MFPVLLFWQVIVGVGVNGHETDAACVSTIRIVQTFIQSMVVMAEAVQLVFRKV